MTDVASPELQRILKELWNGSAYDKQAIVQAFDAGKKEGIEGTASTILKGTDALFKGGLIAKVCQEVSKQTCANFAADIEMKAEPSKSFLWIHKAMWKELKDKWCKI